MFNKAEKHHFRGASSKQAAVSMIAAHRKPTDAPVSILCRRRQQDEIFGGDFDEEFISLDMAGTLDYMGATHFDARRPQVMQEMIWPGL